MSERGPGYPLDLIEDLEETGRLRGLEDLRALQEYEHRHQTAGDLHGTYSRSRRAHGGVRAGPINRASR